jgi:hypothetical protein
MNGDIFIFLGSRTRMGIILAYVVKADDRGRIKLPKDIVTPGDRFLVIPVGRRIVLLKIPPKPVEASSSWLRTEKDKGELRSLAESQAIKEVEDKLRRKGIAD